MRPTTPLLWRKGARGLSAGREVTVAFQAQQNGTAHAVQQAPAFVMAHVLQAYLLVCSRDPRRVGPAQRRRDGHRAHRS